MSLRGTDPTTKSHLKDLLRQEVPENLEVIVAVEEQSDPASRRDALTQPPRRRRGTLVHSGVDPLLVAG
ncbi:MAG: hypothetical protein BRD30_03165, partial [Bacteroidetes bacterium QH_2_63_10]